MLNERVWAASATGLGLAPAAGRLISRGGERVRAIVIQFERDRWLLLQVGVGRQGGGQQQRAKMLSTYAEEGEG